MDKLLDEIESYWSTRTEGYSEVNEKELNGMQKKAWLETLERGFLGKRSGKNEDSENNSMEKEVFEEEFSEKQHTDKYKDHLRILDIGTGPGFFPMILAEAGYHVTAIDYTPGMLEKAAENAAKFIGEKSRNIEFKRMDAQALEFEDESFDVIISRNLTWNLPHPEMAYKEWLRVLKKGGKLLNFDATGMDISMMIRSVRLTRTTVKMWKKEAWMTIICAQILTEWRKLRCRFRCRRPSVRDGM